LKWHILFSSTFKNNWIVKVLAFFALMFSFCMPILANAYTGVTIVISSTTPTNNEFIEDFKEELVSGKDTNLRVKVIELQDAEKLVVAENSELVIALGEKALKAASKLKHSTPVLGIFTSMYTFNSLLLTSRRNLDNFSAVVIDQPYWRRVTLIKAILPDVKTLGVLLGPTSSENSELLKEVGEKSAVNILQENINNETELIPKLQKILDSADALMAIPDPLVYSRETAEPILLTSYRYQKPVFGYSESYVRSGALAGVYSSTKQLARQAAEIAVNSQQAPSLLPPPQTPKYFSVAINYQVARSLNIQLADADTIYKKMFELEAAR
jgi:putative tryptophan/tyrosine transport system substrate-binding protein